VTNPDRTANQIAVDEQITQIPTWEFPDGSRHVGLLSVEAIATRSGLTIPQSSLPVFRELEDTSVELGSPLHIPIDAYDPNGEPLTISVRSSNPSVVSAQVLTGNRSLRLETSGYGDLVFELFENRAPRPSSRVIELAESGFYDDVPFHRVINNFVIQGGDPTGTGSGGSSLGDFDDQFHVDLQHNRSGVLSFAKSTDDTNDSQFFVTEVATRYLDFNHSIFGQLTEGEHVREAISNILTNAFDRPVFNVLMRSATVFEDTENGIVVLRAMSQSGTAEITVTVTDPQGNAYSQSFMATAVPDAANGAPFLNPIPSVPALAASVIEIPLSSQDAEGDEVQYSVMPLGDTIFNVQVDSGSGLVRLETPPGFTGELAFKATVQQINPTTTSSKTDEQIVTVQVFEQSPLQNPLLITDVNQDGVTTPIDALLVINFLNNASGNPNVLELSNPPPFFDVNGDLFISPIDSLLVINALNAEGEGEGANRPVQWSFPIEEEEQEAGRVLEIRVNTMLSVLRLLN
ncbi:MAG: peptidylprolyl isomerase, partial [bacterium]|nr:peptidylprolyl isomerase [bacterium]